MYNYCPKCGVKYSKRELENFFKRRDELYCSKCKFVFYNNPKPCVAAIIIDKYGRILLTKRAIEPYKNWWDLPGGFIKHGEDPVQAILREIREELGVEGKVKRLIDTFGESYDNLGKTDQRYGAIVLVYKTRLMSHAIMAGDDVSDYQYFSVYNLPAKIAFPNKRKFIKKYLKNL